MVASSFSKALGFVLREEGGNVDNPRDPGGRTSRGVTQRSYNAYRRLKHEPVQDVYRATEAEIHEIYYTTYWEPYGDRLAAGVDLVYFDEGVNAGPHRSIELLQRALGIAADGIFGPVTAEAAANADPRELVQKFTAERAAYYRSLHEGIFLHGWLNRAAAAQGAALLMIGG